MSGRRLGLIAALALVVLANAVVLTGVARNRSGTDARVELTERECPLVKSLKDDDDSGMALELTAHWPNGLSEDGSPGIDRETLRALGFDVSMPLNSPRADGFYRRALPRDAFVVLEMEGPAWRRWLVEQQQHADLAATQSQALDLDWERRMGTRLFYVAAGRDPEALRQRYPDRAHYLILPAKVRLLFFVGESKKPILYGTAELLSDRVHVPLALRPILDQTRRQEAVTGQHPAPKVPYYRLTLATGKRHEPWLEKVERVAP
ncbi:MAG TPA: DUF4824 family protein [Thermoanaerobaculia bacterium]|nr:DUF4824 family protein [Thermoanaerobaculia bacterium]